SPGASGHPVCGLTSTASGHGGSMARSLATRLTVYSAMPLLAAWLAACSDGSGSGAGTPKPAQCDRGDSYASTFEGIQKVIFEQHGCTQDVCHGGAKQGALQLTPDVAYKDIFDVPSAESTLKRIEPGDKDRSYLWLKLAAKTDPTKLPTGFS